MSSLKKAAKETGGNDGRWDDPLKSDKYEIPTKSTLIRAWDEVHEVHSHFVEFYSEKKKGKTGYPELCPNWDPVKEEAIDGGCPLCEAGQKPQVHMYLFIIDRRAQQKSGTTLPKVVRFTKKFAGKIGRLSEMAYPDMEEDQQPDPTDRKMGFDFWISQSNNNGKTEYDCNAGDKKPLTKDEIAIFTEFAEERPIGKLVKKFIKPRNEILQSLQRSGVEGFGKPASRDSGQNKTAKRRTYEDYDAPPEDEERPARKARPADDDEEAPPARKPTRASREEDEEPKAKVPKRASLTGDDEDEEDVRPRGKSRFDEEDEAPKKPARSYATPNKNDVPEDDDE